MTLRSASVLMLMCMPSFLGHAVGDQTEKSWAEA